VALLAALLVASVALLLLKANPIDAYQAMFDGAFGDQNATAETLVKATPLIFVGLGITIAFRGGVINIGGEGQMIVGALSGTAVVLFFDELPGIPLIGLSLLAGFVGGALWGGLAGFLKAYFDVNEILSTIMLNLIAVQAMNFLLKNPPMRDDTSDSFNAIPKTRRILEHAELPRLAIFDLFERTRLHWGLMLAIGLAFVIYIFMWRTTLGFRIRAVGENQRAATYAGINPKRYIVLSMLLAGGMAGLAGVVQVLGLQYRLQTDGSPQGFTGNAGFNGIVAALFGGLHPLGTIPAAVFFGSLLVGAQKLQREIQVSSSLITGINGLVVIFVVSSQIFIKRRAKRRVTAANTAEEAQDDANSAG
jgi:simple sugar transport system permease protein